MEPLGWDDDDGRDGNNNWDLNAVLRFGSRVPISPPTRNNNPVARYAPPPAPPPPQPSYAATVLFHGGLGHQAIAALPQPQQALPHPHAAGWWGPSLDLPPLLPAVVGGTPEHQAPPLNPPWPRNEIPMLPVVQPPANKHTTAPSSSSGCHAAEGSSRRSKTRGKNRKANDRRKEILVPADDPTPPDSWAWRKYGEKAIKHTPYHRSYYRCSTDRSCKARKHVQRCLTQPSLLAVSYVGEHSHPMPLVVNSQAGTTRPKTPPPPPQRQPTSPFIRNKPAREKQPPASAPSAAATSPFAKIIPATHQEQQQTPSASPASASSASLLPAVSARPLRIQDVEQPPEASATALAPSASSPMMSSPDATLLRSPYVVVYKEGDDSRPMPLVCDCLVCTTRQKTPLPLPPSPVIEIPSRESQPLGPALLAAPVPYSLSPNIPLPPSPLLKIPAVEEQQQTPALPANASAWQPSNAPLPPVSPLLSFQAAEECPTQQVPAPVLPPSSVVSTLMSSPTTLLPPPSVEFDNEEDDDAVAVRMLLEDMDMTPEDALMFVDPEEEPLDSVGDGDGLLIQAPDELAPSYSYYGDEENMIYPMAYDEPASGGSGSSKRLMFPPSPVTYDDYEAAAALGSSGSAWTGDGAGTAPCVQPLTANVVNEIFNPRHDDERLPPLQPAAATYWDWEW